MMVNTSAAEKFPRSLLCEILRLNPAQAFGNQNAWSPLAWRMSRRSMPSGLTRGWYPVRRQGHAMHRGTRCPVDLLDDVQLAKQRQLIGLTQNGSILSNPSSVSINCTRTFPATRSRSSCLTGLIWATIRKTIPRRNSTSSTASQSDGSPTISQRQRPQKNERELVTPENIGERNEICFGDCRRYGHLCSSACERGRNWSRCRTGWRNRRRRA